jgi:hypothetical protein
MNKDFATHLFSLAADNALAQAKAVTARQCAYRKCENEARPKDEFCSDKCFMRDELEQELRNEEDDMRAHEDDEDGGDDE